MIRKRVWKTFRFTGTDVDLFEDGILLYRDGPAAWARARLEPEYSSLAGSAKKVILPFGSARLC